MFKFLFKSVLCISLGNFVEVDVMRVVLFVLFVVIMFLVWSWLYYDFSIFVDYVFYVCKDEIGQIYYYNIIFVGYEFCD